MTNIIVSKEEWESLKKDKERLDFLEECHTKLNEKCGTDYGWEIIINHNVVRMMMERNLREFDLNDAAGGNAKIKTCRLAIDKKMEEFARQREAYQRQLLEKQKREEYLKKLSNILIETNNTDMLNDLVKYK